MDDSERNQIFDSWLDDHTGLLFKIVRTFAASSHDQDDLFQQIALQLWKSIPTYTGQVAVTTWMYRVAFFTATGWTRKEKHRRRIGLLGDADRVLVQVSKPAKDDRLDALFTQITSMSEVDRALALMVLDGLNYREMAEVLGITENNVGVRISRIKKRLICSLSKESNHEIR